ncbi:MAG: tyrosine recombinase XerC, partial [Actinomycetes bacterium]
LTPSTLSGFYRALLTDARRDGQGLAPKTVRNIHAMLHRALRDAVRLGYLVRNVADAVTPPRGASPEMQVWTPEQLRAFLTHARQDRLYALWLLVATTGMRRAELAGLRWVDVDLDAARLSPRRPRVVVNYLVHESEPKTRMGQAVPGAGPGDAGRPAGAQGSPGPRTCRGRVGLDGLGAGVHPTGRLPHPPGPDHRLVPATRPGGRPPTDPAP